MYMEISRHQQKILQAIDSASTCLFSVSHQIHQKPEMGYQEKFASGLLCDTLAQYGFTVERGYAGIPTAFCARRGKGQGPRVAFLAEYDALPDLGHGCGHNIIATSALAAGIGLGEIMAEIPGEVCVIGTPAEETDGAKVTMVERGAFQGIDAALMIHPHAGTYYLTESLAMDAVEVEFFGKPSHAAAAPWDGVNALDALLATFNSLNSLRQQIRPDARIHGIIVNGGTAPNIIPDHTLGRFYLRAKLRAYLNELNQKFLDCVKGAATASGTRFQTRNYENSFDDMLNNLVLAERMRDYLTGIIGVEKVDRAPEHFGSIDMGNVSYVVPAVHVLVDVTQGKPFSMHTTNFKQAVVTPYADATILKAGKALALTGYDILVNATFREAAWEEFKRNTAF
jgi:amidohydrolase